MELNDQRKNINLRKFEVSVEKKISLYIDFKVTSSGCHYVKVLSAIGSYFLVAMVTDLCRHLTYDSRGAWHTAYAMLHSNYK